MMMSSLTSHNIYPFITFFVFHSLFTLSISYNNNKNRAEPGTRGLKQILKEIYVLYADCTLKDPFYELEMPIRCDLFTQAVEDLIQNFDESNSMMYGSNSGIGGGSSGVRNNDPIVKLR